MNSKTWLCASALGLASSLSGCYIVPMDSHLPPVPPGAPFSPATSAPVTVPAGPGVLQARLYPLNDSAGKTGALTANVSDTGTGRATFTLNYAGEQLNGEATRVPAGYAGFGNVHREVYGSGSMPAGQRGVASASGSQGTFVNCEYALTAPNRGTGACLFSNGAKYQLHFGS